MPSYNAPGVYLHDLVSGSQSIELLSASVGALFGKTKRGTVGKVQKIGSWTEYIEKYAKGLDSPFDANSYLPYAVYGFFANGGKELYVGSIKKSGVKATATDATTKITATAKDEGAWGNAIKVTVAESASFVTTTNEVYDVTVACGAEDVITVKEIKADEFNGLLHGGYGIDNYLSVLEYDTLTGVFGEKELTLATGSDGTALTDSDYVDALNWLDTVDDATLVGIPGQTSSVVNSGIVTYCENNGLFPMLDMPLGTTAEDAKTIKKAMQSAFTGEIAHPWIKVNDPLTNALKTVPTVGHLMGLYARVIESRGVHKAPAGVDASIRGAVEMEYQLTSAELSTLNPIGIVCIMSRPNAGIVAWGARSLNTADSTMKYVTDGLLNLNIKRSLYNGTQYAVFEPNDESLWSRVQATCKDFLETLRQSGALKGSAKEAYYVTVDGTNNTEATIALGQLNIEIGYAPVKPAEFVIIKLAHSIVSQ